MDDAPGRGIPQPPEPDRATERTSGISLETCYRHPKVVTGVHCTRCDRPICPDCMTAAPVGYQCPECVAEARRTAPRRPRARVQLILGRPGGLTTILLGANIALFLVELATGAAGGLGGGGSAGNVVDLGAMVPILVARQHQYWRLFTAMFLHASLLHIFFNMYALYLFGYLMENALGTARFAAIYFVCGLFASVTSFAFSNPLAPAVGASGAIFALLGAWVAYNFRRRGNVMASANLRWALMLIGINLLLGFTIPNIDNFAHLGGLASGAVAGWFVEGFGPSSVRRLVPIGGFTLIGLVGVAMTVARVAALS